MADSCASRKFARRTVQRRIGAHLRLIRASAGVAISVAALLLRGASAAKVDAEQIHVAVVGQSAVVVSWASPGYQEVNLVIEEIRPPGAEAPNSVSSTRRVIRPTTESYRFQNAEGNLRSFWRPGVYTSPLLLHANVSVQPSASYRYCVGEGREAGPWRHFRAPPAAGAARLRLAIVGDLGQTEFSRSTCRSLADAHAARAVDVGVLLGDLAYADGDASRWDSFGRLFEESGCADIPWLVLPGNHEVEPDSITGQGFVPYRRRWRTPEVRPEQVGDDLAVHVSDAYDKKGRYDYGGSFYSLRLGPAHLVVMNPYTPAHKGSAQEAWLRSELGTVSRDVTPFLIAFTHAPWHHSSNAHRPENDQGTAELKATAEPLLRRAGAAFLFAGHVHAYERTAPIGGVTHVVAGNGGNYEGLCNSWHDSDVSENRQGEYYGWGELDVFQHACSWSMRRSHDSAVIDSAVVTRARTQAPSQNLFNFVTAIAVVSTSLLVCILCYLVCRRRCRRSRVAQLESAMLTDNIELPTASS